MKILDNMKRGIAGSMVFHLFNREALLGRLKDTHLFLANRYSLQEAALFSKVYDVGLQSGLLRTSSFVDTSIGSSDANFGPIAITIDKVLASPWSKKIFSHVNSVNSGEVSKEIIPS